MATITAANASIALGVTNYFPVAQQIQGFAAEDIFDSEMVEPAEAHMGVDGKLSAGMVNVPIPWTLSLQADSTSITFFEAWYAAQKALQDVYFAFGIVNLADGRVYEMNRGVLTGYTSLPDAKKYLQPRKFRILWESIIAVPVA